MHGHSLTPDHPLFHVSHMLRYIATLYSLLQMARYQHYISTAEVCSAPISTYEAQEQLAQVIFHKLVEFNYIQREG